MNSNPIIKQTHDAINSIKHNACLKVCFEKQIDKIDLIFSMTSVAKIKERATP